MPEVRLVKRVMRKDKYEVEFDDGSIFGIFVEYNADGKFIGVSYCNSFVSKERPTAIIAVMQEIGMLKVG